MKRQKRRWRISARVRKVSLITAAIVGLLFIGANALIWAMYRDRTYPQTRVLGNAIGAVSYDRLTQKIDERKLLPTTVQLTHQDQSVDVLLDDLGISKDAKRTTESATQQRTWLPILNLFRTTNLQAPVAVDTARFESKTTELSKTFRKDAVDARLNLAGATVTINQAADGYELAKDTLQSAVLRSLDSGQTHVPVPTSPIAPAITADTLRDKQKQLQDQLKGSVIYRFESKTKQASAEDIATWFVQTEETYALSLPAVQAYVTKVGKDFGIRVKDAATIAKDTVSAVSSAKPYDINLTAQKATKTYSYCVATRGVDTSHLPTMRTMLKSAFSDDRGWSLDGLVSFQEVSSGCSFTVWLAAAEQMPSFGTICDSMWSCRVGPNVVLNFDRWQSASPAWNANGGTLEEYRNMVINHETGHWLGFGHSHCPGTGQPAPVMQQQSINLQGCEFNAWPTASERDSLRRSLGL